MNHYDNNGHKTGHSSPGLFGGVNTYDNNGHKKRHSEKKFLWADIIIMRSNGDDNYDFDKS